MKTLQTDLWEAFEDLNKLWTAEKVLDELTQYLGNDTVRRFLDEVIHEWDLEEYFRDYREFAED